MLLSECCPSEIVESTTGQKEMSEAGEVVAWLGAVQAQDFAAAKWALALHMPERTPLQGFTPPTRTCIANSN
jgi:hypothetical protein